MTTSSAPYKLRRGSVRGEWLAVVLDENGDTRILGYINKDAPSGAGWWQAKPNRPRSVWLGGYATRNDAAEVLWQDWVANNFAAAEAILAR